jgi:membrane glycosyltransferase
VSRTGFLSVLGVVLVIGFSILGFGLLPTLIVVLSLLVIALVLGVIGTRTAIGRRGAARVGVRLVRTRVGRRMQRASLKAQAEKQGIRTVDGAGRPLSDVEIQLELMDTPEARAIKKQLRTMNPVQRAQALRMMQAQAEGQQARGEVAPPPQSRQTARAKGRPVPQRPPGKSGKRPR